MSKTHVLTGAKARQLVFQGIETVADAVGATLGPMGQCVIIEREGTSPHVTKDGATVAKSIMLRDRVKCLGAELVKEAAARTNEEAGDGTTTSTVIAHSLCRGLLRLLSAGHRAPELTASIDAACTAVVAEIAASSNVVGDGDLERIATISANGETAIGKMVADAISAVGRDGIVTVEESKGSASSIELVDGMRIDRGFASPYFINDPGRSRCVLEEPYILVCDEDVTTLRDLIPVLEKVHRQSRALLLLAPGIDGEAMQLLVLNRMQNELKVCAVASQGYDFGPQRTESLLDVCALTGAKLCSVAAGDLKTHGIADLGTCKRALIDKSTTTIVLSKRNEEACKRAAEIRDRLDEPGLDASVALMMRDRLARLAGSAAIVRAGGTTELEMRERRDRVDDALCATRAALEEGVVAGGGVCLLRASIAAEKKHSMDDPGCKLLFEACRAPLMRVAENAGASPSVVIEKLREAAQNIGFDARANEFVDVTAAGIIDPAKVERVALENAVSIAKAFASMSAVVVEDEERQ